MDRPGIRDPHLHHRQHVSGHVDRYRPRPRREPSRAGERVGGSPEPGSRFSPLPAMGWIARSPTPAPLRGALRYQWDFGEPASGADNSSTDQNPTHTYSATVVTDFTVTLTVTDGAGSDPTRSSRQLPVTPPASLPCSSGPVVNCAPRRYPEGHADDHLDHP